MQRNKKKWKAYFTVEASMVIPVVIFVLAFLIYVTFMLYGKCIVLQDAYILAFRASRAQDMEDPDAFVRQQKQMQFGRKYFGNDPGKVQAWKDGDDIYVSIKINTRHNAIHWPEIIEKRLWENEVRMKAEAIDAPARIRHARRVTDLIRQAAGKGESGKE
ncbi:MAG: pilus assembly protein [Butyrivibrio sp.]|nr:pilus assembly protein [Butyrivibrio sp.]